MSHDPFAHASATAASLAPPVAPAWGLLGTIAWGAAGVVAWFAVQFAVVIAFIAWQDHAGAWLGRSGQARA